MEQLICDSLNGVRTMDNMCHGPTYPGQGHRSTRTHGRWKLEGGNWRAIPGCSFAYAELCQQSDVFAFKQVV